MEQPPEAIDPATPSPSPPDLPAAIEESPYWPPWFGFAALIASILVAAVATAILALLAGLDLDEDTWQLAVIGTLIQGACFVGSALILAGSVSQPRPWQFGFRRAHLWTAVGWAALGMFAFYAFAVAYTQILRPDIDQDVVETLGSNEGTLGLIAAGVMVVAVAPIVEEIFFRGFFYRALRGRYPVVLAAIVNGLVFGGIHAGGADSLLVVPPLAVLGMIFCLVYEKTGTIYAVIGLHMFNNAIAYAANATPDGWIVVVVVAPLMLAGLVIVPALLPDGPRPLPVRRKRPDPQPQLSFPVE